MQEKIANARIKPILTGFLNDAANSMALKTYFQRALGVNRKNLGSRGALHDPCYDYL